MAILPNSQPAFVQVATDGSGKRIANYSCQMYIDPGDGTGPVLQTVYFQAVDVYELDENGIVCGNDDKVDYVWKRQLLDEMRAIRIGMEYLLEMTPPTYKPSLLSLLEEAQQQRSDNLPNDPTSLDKEL